jgi:hypothetical protein
MKFWTDDEFFALAKYQQTGCFVFNNDDEYTQFKYKTCENDGFLFKLKEYIHRTHDNNAMFWYKNGELHREDGPAIQYADGSKSWYKEGKRHRLDGPAIERSDGFKSWYIEGFLYTEEEFKIKSFVILNNLEKFL